MVKAIETAPETAIEARAEPSPFVSELFNSGSKESKAEWTIVINLATNTEMKGKDGLAIGSEQLLKTLKESAVITKNKPLNIMVQVLSRSENQDDGNSAQQWQLYAISDGKQRLLEQRPEMKPDLAKDLEYAISQSQKHYPAKKLGLVLFSHGNGNRGMSTDSGDSSVSSIVAGLKSGLQSAGRQKLDLINLNACVMAQLGVLNQMAAVTDNLVASADIQWMLDGIVGQNLPAWLSKLSRNPESDGQVLAKQIVASAAEGANNNGGLIPGTPTLASFDLRKSREVSDLLNQIGSELLTAAKSNPDDLHALKAVLTRVHYYVNFEKKTEKLQYSFSLPYKHDLLSFGFHLNQAIKTGELKGTPELAEKLAKFMELHKEHQLSRHIENKDLLTKGVAGLTEFFLPPELQKWSKNTAAESLFSPQGSCSKRLNSQDFVDPEFIEAIKQDLAGLKNLLSKEDKKSDRIGRLESSMESLSKISTAKSKGADSKEYSLEAKRFCSLYKGLGEFKAVQEHLDALASEIRASTLELFAANQIPEHTRWQEFIEFMSKQ